MKDPKLYLCIDNCFAYKRWVKPMDWMLLVKEMGAQYVEQSADTECDPLYHGAEYMRGWIRETREASEKTGGRDQFPPSHTCSKRPTGTLFLWKRNHPYANGVPCAKGMDCFKATPHK